MAAESTRIKLKRSTTAAVVPTTSNLADGEVAVNIADRKIYVRNGANIVEVANQKPNTGEVTTTMLATDITNGPGQTYYVSKNGSDSTLLGSTGANGKHPDTPFLTLAKALSTATSGDTIHISAGTYTETFPLTVPDGVTVKGAGLRSVLIQPSPSTKSQNGFVLNGDTIVSDLTIGGIQYDSGNDRGYAFICASNWDSTRSSYVERVTVLNRGSVTSLSDPYGYAQGDAGRGAKLDGAVSSSNSYEAAVLFNECTFFTPNQIGLYLTNGIRIEALNCFFYFASEAITGVSGATGVAGAGRTRLKLGGVSGTFSASEVIYELNNNFVTGTYSQSGTTVTVTSNSHGLSNGDIVAADYLTGTAVGGFFTVSSAATNTFVLTAAASATTSGNIQYKKALAYGTIDENDGTYVYLTNKGTGEFSSTISNAKTAVTTGDAKLSTAQYQFGTSSLVFDGTGDFISYVTDPNFGFGLGDFTIECFARFNVVNANQGLFEFRAAAGTEVAPYLYLGSDGKLRFSYGATTAITAGNALVADTWYHIAASRTGNQTKLFVNGVQEGATFTDNNNYGSTKTLRIGSLQNAGYVMNGYIDEVRISKGTGRYTSNFTAPAAAFVEDLYTVLLLHLDGANSSTTILDSSGSTKDIRSSGGDSATVINLADYTDFGAELRSIGCAALYGNKGVVADGLGVSLRLTAVNFEYIGTGSDITNNTAGVVQSNEVNELNGGRVYYTSQDQSGNFRVGDLFLVDQELGNVTFSAVTQNAQSAANITLSDGTGTTNLYPAYIETGNLRLSGNTLSSNSGQIILDPSADEDIVLNAEVISPEKIFFDSGKVFSLGKSAVGQTNFYLGNNVQVGVSSYGYFSNKNIGVNKKSLDTITIADAGTGYTPGIYSAAILSNPDSPATATATLKSTGLISTITITNPGSLYTLSPTVTTLQAPVSGSVSFSVVRGSGGGIGVIGISSGGSGYVSPTATVPDPPNNIFDASLITGNTIDLTIVHFKNNDAVIYDSNGNSSIGGLTSGNTYYVRNRDLDNDTIQLSGSPGGPVITLTPPLTQEQHYIRGTTALITPNVSGGSITSFTINNPGTGYIVGIPINITLSETPASPGSFTVNIGSEIREINTSGAGEFSSVPTLIITPQALDSGTGAAATVDALKYELNTITLNYNGYGYSKVPFVTFSGNPDIDAVADATLDIETGSISEITLTSPGSGYLTAPTVSIVGGAGSDAQASITVLPVAGNILSNGSGYRAGTYPAVAFTGGTGSGAIATFFVRGFFGTITNAGSGYTNGTYQQIDLFNTPTTTYTVTVAPRTKLDMSGSGITGTINVGDTANNGSGVTATVTYVGSNFAFVDPATISGGTFSQGNIVTFTSGGSGTLQVTPISPNRYFINGQESPDLTLIKGNTYRFDLSSPTVSNHPFVLDSTTSTDPNFVVKTVGAAGSSGAFVDIIIKPTAATSSNTVFYTCTVHGRSMSEDAYIDIISGTVGSYGSGGQINVTADAGSVSSVSFVTQGSGYKAGDVVSVPNGLIGGGSGFSYTIDGNDTGISQVTNIQSAGSGYTVADILSVSDSNVGSGGGAGFQFTVTEVGYVSSAVVTSGGNTFYPNQTILFDPQNFAGLGSGSNLSLLANTVNTESIIELKNDGAIVSDIYNISASGTFTTSSGSNSSSLGTSGLTTTGNITASGSLNILSTASITGSLTVNGTTTLSNNLTANGSNNQINNALIDLQNGSAASPSLKFENSLTTGLYRDSSDVLGFSISGTKSLSLSSTELRTINDLIVDSSFATVSPFFKVDSIGESVDIGTFTSGLRITNAASIEAIGSNQDVDITLIPLGEGNLQLTGGLNKDFLITDGSSETFRVDTESGNTTIKGNLKVNANLQLEDNIISNIGTTATTSFGQIITVTATGTGTGFTTGTYTNVTSTTNGSGSDATFNVTVAGGDITTISVYSGGAGYNEGDTITLNSATIGSGSGKTITVTDIEGAGIVIKPQVGKNVKIDSTAMFVVPSGNTNQRPTSGDRQTGGIRFNTQQQQFEGYNGQDFVSLGGVRDVNQDTYILTELSPGSNEDTFFFYNQGINSLDIVQDKFKLYTARTFETSGTLVLDGVSLGSDPLDVRTLGSSVLRVRSRKDVEITNGLRFKSVPVLGEIATIGTVTSGAGVYTPSQTSTVTSTSQFEGSGATFTVITDGAGSILSVSLVVPGSDYEVGEIITISGSLLGGTTPANDVTFPVATITNTTPAFTRLDILQQDYITQLDSKPFLSLDANGAEAAWKINRGWNAGTESYLTVFDSTATFMELNDCRVEGGQLSSFGANATIVQFNKTAYKGAKTLVTIESNDGKVHMLEVTTVCAAAGTTAYATITNSVTSSNDLVDASVTVVGNNVNISIAKSSAATSSTSFTGRYTTTKVKV